MTRPIKRSLTIAGHRTSVSLEAAFWDALQEVARHEATTVAQLVARIDDSRTVGDDGGGLSSAIRVHLLYYYRGRASLGGESRRAQ